MNDLHSIPGGSSLWRDAMRRFAANRVAMAGCLFLALLGLVSLITPWIVPYSYAAQDLALGAAGPSAKHWFGTDMLGRDVFTRVLISSATGCATHLTRGRREIKNHAPD